ncbi:hypothetical protein BDV98DRAFT_557192 [Pterulicium gracile]|uniref:BTB domain-containing protein n=1 Tax=Pterulicium gracile TaxID=1884261 RepID=A0A5C3R2Z7_9AGAR|nr:hypothetical protein BDV98DRAFT_557192 [Pterula gracilis]
MTAGDEVADSTSASGGICHPDFLPSESPYQMCLVSTEGTIFYVPSYCLLGSGFFRTMLSLPQAPEPHFDSTLPKRSAEPIHTNEPQLVLAVVLKMMCAQPFPPWTNLDDVESILFLAERWDIPFILSTIRTAITSSALLTADPLRLFYITTHFGWDDEARIASEHTLDLSLFDSQHAEKLARLTAKDLLALLDLHRSRRLKFKELLNSQDAFNVGNSPAGSCVKCGATLDNHTWRDLKAAMVDDLDRNPRGDTLFGGMGCGGLLDESAVAMACWRAQCSYCKQENYDKRATIQSIRACVQGLRSTV